MTWLTRLLDAFASFVGAAAAREKARADAAEKERDEERAENADLRRRLVEARAESDKWRDRALATMDPHDVLDELAGVRGERGEADAPPAVGPLPQGRGTT